MDRATRRVDDGRVLIGGAPLLLLQLNQAAALAVHQLASGERIGDTPPMQKLARRLLNTGMAHPRPEPTLRTSQDVTIVIPFCGNSQELAATLDRLGPAAEVIVVDDASPDPTVADTATARGATVIRHAINRGPSAARNSGWRAATGDLVAFVDGGCLPEDRWLEGLLPHFDDPLVAAVAPRITTVIASSLLPVVGAYEAAHPTLDRGVAEAPVWPGGRVPFVPTAALVVRRTVLHDVNGFDEAMRTGEDVDLVWRLVAREATVRYAPNVSVAHISRPTVAAWLRQRFFYGTSAAPLARRHRRAVAPLVVSTWSAAAWGLAGVGAPLAGVAVAAGSAGMLVPRLRKLQNPWSEAARLAGLGHLYAGLTIAEAMRRSWWPLAVVAGTYSPRARRVTVAAWVGPLLVEWYQKQPQLDPLRWVALHLADDLTYGAGVWAGCLRERSVVALCPDLTTWPGRRRSPARS